MRSREDLIRFMRVERDTSPDAGETIEDLVAEEDRVAVTGSPGRNSVRSAGCLRHGAG